MSIIYGVAYANHHPYPSSLFQAPSRDAKRPANSREIQPAGRPQHIPCGAARCSRPISSGGRFAFLDRAGPLRRDRIII